MTGKWVECFEHIERGSRSVDKGKRWGMGGDQDGRERII